MNGVVVDKSKGKQVFTPDPKVIAEKLKTVSKTSAIPVINKSVNKPLVNVISSLSPVKDITKEVRNYASPAVNDKIQVDSIIVEKKDNSLIPLLVVIAYFLLIFKK